MADVCKCFVLFFFFSLHLSADLFHLSFSLRMFSSFIYVICPTLLLGGYLFFIFLALSISVKCELWIMTENCLQY